jgi:transcriptional regulator of PTS gene
MNSLFLTKSFTGKNEDLKKKIIRLCIHDKNYSIADFSEDLDASIPTVTKIVGELITDGFLLDFGKQGTSGGRKPSLFGLNPAVGYIVGAQIEVNAVSIAVTDFKGNPVDHIYHIPFTLEKTEESYKKLATLIKKSLNDMEVKIKDIIVCGLAMHGRVNHKTGASLLYALPDNKSISAMMEKELGVPTVLDNGSMAMAYAEYLASENGDIKNMLFINVGWGLGMGIIVDGKLYYGKNGYAGEIGHMPTLDNDQICECGKIGCLQTGASGQALRRILIEKLKAGRNSTLKDKFKKGGDLTLNDIISAIQEEDVLTMECIEEVGFTLGRALAGLMKIFDPELIVIGGALSSAQDSLLLPIRSEVNKYSFSALSKDVVIRMSELGFNAGPLGACMLARSNILGLI